MHEPRATPSCRGHATRKLELGLVLQRWSLRSSHPSCQSSCWGSGRKHSAPPRTTTLHLVNSAEVKHAYLRPRGPTVAASV